MDWYFWRPVHARHGTLLEIERDWSLEDLEACHALLDAFDAARIEAEED